MNERLQHLARRIRDELSELERVNQRVAEGWQRAIENADDYYLDGVALNLHDRLDEYRGFRHVVRNVYTYNFEAAKIQKLVTELPATLEQTRAELLAFASFLEHQAKD